MKFSHVPVLKDECMECLHVKEGGIYIDGTLGGGGHSFYILSKLNNTGRLIAIDKDMEAIQAAKEKLKGFSNVIYVNDKHENIKEILNKLNIEEADAVLLDLGVSSYQLDNEDRGFSYTKNAALDMRMDKTSKLTAKDVVNKYSEEELINIFFKYSEEKYSKYIAKNIIIKRQEKEIETTYELVEIIKESMPRRALVEKQHPAKRIFQAIRIEVNGELTNLENTIIDSVNMLKKGGRILVITFHSLEDRIVKRTFEKLEGRCTCPSDFPKCICNYISFGRIITKKPIEANIKELENNSRARSAKLRVFERI